MNHRLLARLLAPAVASLALVPGEAVAEDPTSASSAHDEASHGGESDATTDDAAVGEPTEIAPPPFDAETLTTAITRDERWCYQLTSLDEQWIMCVEAVAIGTRGPLFAHWTTERDGTPRDPRTESSTSWAELVLHASWPADITTITPAQIEVPFGTFEGLHYRVDHGEGSRIDSWFALEIPGPPVRSVQTASGVVVLTSELIEHAQPEASPRPSRGPELPSLSQEVGEPIDR